MKNQLSILHVCPRPSFSGLEAYALSLAIDQKQRGCNVSFYVLPDSPLALQCQAQNFEIILPDEFKNRLKVGIQNRNWDIIHLHSTQDLNSILPSMLGAKFKSLKLPKVILQTHILISHSKKDPIHFLKYLFVDEMWCSSLPAKKMLEGFIPIAKEKIKIKRYGRNIEKTLNGFLSRNDARKILGVPTDAVVAGLVSRIDPQKGIKEFLFGALDLVKKYSQLHLVFIGGRTQDDPKAWAYADELEKFHKALPDDLRSRIHFKGEMKDSFQYMRGLDLYALPSYKECFALSLLEAQLAELPVLGTDAGGTPDIVIEGQTGYLFQAKSESSSRAALARALESQNLWSEFGQRAKKRILDEFDFEKISAEVIDSYQKLKDENQ
jgi:glycosyltransferase involved in cell wall biosynthesis